MITNVHSKIFPLIVEYFIYKIILFTASSYFMLKPILKIMNGTGRSPSSEIATALAPIKYKIIKLNFNSINTTTTN